MQNDPKQNDPKSANESNSNQQAHSNNTNGAAHSQNKETSANTSNETPNHLAEITRLTEEAEKFKNEYLYLKAEFENYKRHSIKERSDLSKYGAERFIKDLLGVLDNFERAMMMKVGPENFPTFVKGVELTANELKSLLNKHSVTEIPAEGLPFDPSVHEALSAEPTDKMAPGHVVRVFQKPYKFHDKVLRTGQVVVSQKPAN